MPEHITIYATEEDFKRARRKILGYKRKVQNRVEKLVQKMLDEGENAAFLGAAGHIFTGITIDTIMAYRNGNHGVLSIGGNVVWIEFGTGVYANGQTDHPLLGQVAGVVPHGEWGMKHGKDPNGWYYIGDDGQCYHTYGIPSDPFFYNTAKLLKQEYVTWAKEIFTK